MNYNPITSQEGHSEGNSNLTTSHLNNNQPVIYGQQPDFYDPRLSAEEDHLDVLRIFFFALKYRWLLLSFILTGIIAGILITLLQTPKYRASTHVEIITQSAQVFKDYEVVSQSETLRTFETAKQKMKSRELAQRVVFELNLANNVKFLSPTPTFSLTNLFQRIFETKQQVDLEQIDAEKRQALATAIVKKNTSISLLRNTSILIVSYSHPSPEIARDVTNQIAKSYIEQNVDKKSETSQLARQFIFQQVQETKQKLQKSEKDLVDYAELEGITVTGDEKTLIQTSIADINSALTEALQESLMAERFVQQVKDGHADTLKEVLESETVQNSKLKIAEKKAEYQEKLSTFKPAFPEMVRLNAQIREMQRQLAGYINTLTQSVIIRYEQAKLKETELQKRLAKLEADQATFQKKNIQYTILKREVDSNRKQYDNLIGKLNEVGIGSEIKSGNASIIDRAIVPIHPYSPKLYFNLTVSVVIFTGLSVALVSLIELMSNTFVVPDQIEDELNTPVLGIIPLVEDLQNALPTSPISEAYRTLRTSIQFAGSDKTLRTLYVTSSESSEAKTTTVYKLAEGYAAIGKSVLIIDADLRKPHMHKMFDMENGMGLSNLLSNVIREDKVKDLFKETANPNISFLSAGTIPPNPTDLLMSNKMSLTLYFCSKKYDLVIIDSPPVMGLSDAPILSRLVDATLFVVSSRQVSRKAAQNAIARLRAVGANLIGVAFTKFDVKKVGYEYGYDYLRGNYYTYGLEEGENNILASNEAELQNSSINSPFSNDKISTIFFSISKKIR